MNAKQVIHQYIFVYVNAKQVIYQYIFIYVYATQIIYQYKFINGCRTVRVQCIRLCCCELLFGLLDLTQSSLRSNNKVNLFYSLILPPPKTILVILTHSLCKVWITQIKRNKITHIYKYMQPQKKPIAVRFA